MSKNTKTFTAVFIISMYSGCSTSTALIILKKITAMTTIKKNRKKTIKNTKRPPTLDLFATARLKK